MTCCLGIQIVLHNLVDYLGIVCWHKAVRSSPVIASTLACVENIVGVFNCEPCLVHVRDKARDIFWSCGLEHLDKKQVGEAVDIVVDSLHKGSF